MKKNNNAKSVFVLILLFGVITNIVLAFIAYFNDEYAKAIFHMVFNLYLTSEKADL